MQKNCFIILILALTCSYDAVAQPKFSISKIVGRNSINDADASKIEQYARGWAEALHTTDALQLYEAQRHLIEPLEADAAMSPYARSLYGKALRDGFELILDENSTNEMAAVNALQVVSLLGTEQGCGLLLNHADTSTEDRDSLRHWASIGLGKAFKQGILPDRRVSSIAGTIADFASRESVWYIISRQFNSIASLQDIPNLDTRQQDELEALSIKLQVRAFSELLQEIAKSNEADERVRALPFILASLRLQLIEPGLNEDARKDGDQKIAPLLTQFADLALKHAQSAKENEELYAAYGESLQSGSFIVERILKIDVSDASMLELWSEGRYPDLTSRLNTWKNAQ